MTNDLIKRPPEDDDEHAHRGQITPVEHGRRRAEAARKAEQDAAKASRHGEPIFAFLRREDARGNLQRRWDWGDAPTWIIIAGFCAIGLFIAITAYIMPQGRHMYPPPIRLF